jgi:hypothetical protein
VSDALGARLRPWALAASRAALGVVFLYFGGEELVQPGPWVGYMPPFLPVHVALWLVLAHGFVLFVTGAALAVGTRLRLFLPLSVLLMGSVAADLLLSSGPSAIWFRDFGLTFLAVAVWAAGGGVSLDAAASAAPVAAALHAPAGHAGPVRPKRRP